MQMSRHRLLVSLHLGSHLYLSALVKGIIHFKVGAHSESELIELLPIVMVLRYSATVELDLIHPDSI